MKLVNIDGKKTAVINIFIDPENGFQNPALSDEEGGVLYVPDGEQIPPIMGRIIAKSRGSIFVIGQDYHPRNHISFMVNHPGVMVHRIEKFKIFLEEHGQPVPENPDELYRQAQQPVHFFDEQGRPPAEFPFSEIVLDGERNIVGLKDPDGRIRKVEVTTSSGFEAEKDDRGRVTAVTDQYFPKTFDELRSSGVMLSTQTLWTAHCIQGTKSSLFPAEMNLPKGLVDKLGGDLKKPVISHRDEQTDNMFWVIRKGDNSEIDSYGIGVENDGETLTAAFPVFQRIAMDLKACGCERVIINGGGLATNFCVEFSMNNVNDFLAGFFKMAGMDVDLKYVPEISRGIPVPGGPDVPFSLQGTATRLQRRGMGTTTVAAILALTCNEPSANLATEFRGMKP